MIVPLNVIAVHSLWWRGQRVQRVDTRQQGARSIGDPNARDLPGISSGISPRCLTDEFKRTFLKGPVDRRDTQGVIAGGRGIPKISRSCDFHAEHRAEGDTT